MKKTALLSLIFCITLISSISVLAKAGIYLDVLDVISYAFVEKKPSLNIALEFDEFKQADIGFYFGYIHRGRELNNNLTKIGTYFDFNFKNKSNILDGYFIRMKTGIVKNKTYVVKTYLDHSCASCYQKRLILSKYTPEYGIYFGRKFNAYDNINIKVAAGVNALPYYRNGHSFKINGTDLLLDCFINIGLDI